VVNVGTRVKISGAPGYGDFVARVVALPVTPDGREMVIVMDDEDEIHVFPAKHVESL